MNHEAIYALYPTVVRIDGGNVYDENGDTVDIDLDAVDSWVNPNLYKTQRAENYPQVRDQLDMLWHAIDNGTLNKTSDFYTTIKAVKDTYPKSE